jgi:hypothetical protein
MKKGGESMTYEEPKIVVLGEASELVQGSTGKSADCCGCPFGDNELDEL